LAVFGVVALTAWAIWQLTAISGNDGINIADLLQGIDAAINELILLSVALVFLISVEVRLKRRKALATLHRLRSIAHIVDMHQLTKDPDSLLRPLPPTTASPVRTLTAAELTRYLDYCSEMLALIAKLAALMVQYLQDPIVLSAVNDIESLTSGLSRKIWQKIMILDVSAAAARGAAPVEQSHQAEALQTRAT
jgi:hypothetical protein